MHTYNRFNLRILYLTPLQTINGIILKDTFDGQTLDDMEEEDKELLIASLENTLRIAKKIEKQKYTPKKYR